MELTEGTPRSLLVWGLDKKAWTREKDVIDEHGEDAWVALAAETHTYGINLQSHSRVLCTWLY